MWIKLGNEYLNLSQVIRVRFTKAFRSGHEDLAAEVETLIRGELQIFTRYRGAEAVALQDALGRQTLEAAPARSSNAQASAAPVGQALAATLHDIKVT
ncbi:MAG: hypothetical protein NZO58_10945 [Gemmataceae bacterium]|nr:hypothetical protein [Gemmataceae bacterium]